MISSQDKIAVGVSGGKDSLTLLSLLSQIQQYYPQKFDILAVTIDPCFSAKKTDFPSHQRDGKRYTAVPPFLITGVILF
jgi:tRNA(Ile)-lysidine synthase TilS/MesJ